MKLLKVLMILTGLIGSSSCSTTRYRIIHIDAELKPVCEFAKFTPEEKEYMTADIGKRIFKNQEGCRIRQQANYDTIDIHNKAHKQN